MQLKRYLKFLKLTNIQGFTVIISLWLFKTILTYIQKKKKKGPRESVDERVRRRAAAYL